MFPKPQASPEVKSAMTAQFSSGYGMSNADAGLDPWRPNILIFRPQDYWEGLVDYTPCQLPGGSSDRKESGCGAAADYKVRPKEGYFAALRKGGGNGTGVENRASVEKVGAETVLPTGSDGNVSRCPPQGRGCCHLRPEAPLSGPIDWVDGAAKPDGGGRGGCDKCSPGETSSVEKALHGVLDALRKVRKVREERLRWKHQTTKQSTGPLCH